MFDAETAAGVNSFTSTEMSPVCSLDVNVMTGLSAERVANVGKNGADMCKPEVRVEDEDDEQGPATCGVLIFIRKLGGGIAVITRDAVK